MDRKRRILFPFLALLFTSIVFTFVWFSGFLNSPVLVRLLQGPSASFASLPVWIRYCLLHPSLIKMLARMGLGCSVLGSTTTLYLLLKTEMPQVVSRHLAEVGLAVLLLTGCWFVLLLVSPIVFFVSHPITWAGFGSQLKAFLPGLGKATIILCALDFVFCTIVFSGAKIVGRMKTSTPAWESDSVLQ